MLRSANLSSDTMTTIMYQLLSRLGDKCASSKVIVATVWLKAIDRKSKPTFIPFDMIGEDSLLFLGLDVKKF